ncbi:microsomal signal peptidase [Punctularia strigosozonata HHB-11173 SS5]|uniref:microsomal signal peptidase n=1 Tax=Punctularia strigosozonata (strain HHB-11173) TaxID=741275 RepID=UPI000441638D|nr:microsomal signal peptidase [Punctularia strigosozonata HHB-11173 SS5]EIN06533.1 microsomal signal peptidase [Punctularia strigosozonata HHB-11173 SS5]
MQDALQELIDGKIDFEGQKTVEHIAKVALIALTVVSFIIGFALQSLRITFGVFGIGSLAVMLVVVPPWPSFNRHPVQWLAPIESKKDQ